MTTPTLNLRPMQRADWPAVGALIQLSTNAWYERQGRPPIFPCDNEAMQVYCRVYENLDPGCCVLAEDRASGRLLGSCFYHPRPTHVALGIMNAHPAAFGRGVARTLLRFVTDLADRSALPVRLVSSAVNLDSYSLYNKAGFAPHAVFQDMTLAVPATGLPGAVPGRERVRPAGPADAPAMAALERELCGIEREQDFAYFLANRDGIWHAAVVDRPGGGLDGFLVSSCCPASTMLGPGAMRDEGTAAALIAAEFDHHRGRSPVWLLPADRPALVRTMYDWGARNCELHFAQVRGKAQPFAGVVMPTFLPETG
jgi:GNAT superfamily N-acetyltransferase